MQRIRIVLLLLALASGWLVCQYSVAAGSEWSDNSNCLTCHSDPDLKNAKGKKVGVSDQFTKSIHGSLSCVDCHKTGDWDNTPHFKSYTPVKCGECHTGIPEKWQTSVHGHGGDKAPFQAANCYDCHSSTGDPHRIASVASGAAGTACIRCHTEEAKKFNASTHSRKFPGLGKKNGCATCHPPHGETKLGDPISITRTCQNCHSDAMEKLRNGPHGIHGIHTTAAIDTFSTRRVSCSSCHEPHGVPDPKRSNDAFSNCLTCHKKTMGEFSGSVHQAKLVSNEMTCASCHSVHLTKGEPAFHCGDCHKNELEQYKKSMHFRDDPTGLGVAANCGDCHDRGHGVRRVTDEKSMANPANIPSTCGKCHGDSLTITSDFVRMPMTLSNWSKSVHADKWREWVNKKSNVRGAICVDCHGSHTIQTAGDPTSSTSRLNLPTACGKCHEKPAKEYASSIHGAAAKRGVVDAPACNDCHESHLILPRSNPASNTAPMNVAKDCGRCHENNALTDRFGIWRGVVKSYQDSYHGWALSKSKIVANCNDCHTTHAIHSHLDPRSTTYKDNIATTCGKCHKDSNPAFAASYSHAAFGQVWGIHDYVRVFYIILIILVLGGMFVHNVIVYAYHLREHRKQHLTEKYIVRMNKIERQQHYLLLITFIGLGITGLALRNTDTWWVKGLHFLGMDETRRALIHRILAVLLTVDSFWHLHFVLTTQRGREKIKNYLPNLADATLAIQNVMFHLRLRKDPPRFEAYDYTQKAEYWALVWGTFIMAVTGVILWFPAIATSWSPGWVVRVAGVIHYYEAILAVSAIVIWHFFFVMMHPKQYPMSWTFITGRMSLEEWKHHHGQAADKTVETPGFVQEGDPNSTEEKHHEAK